MQLKPASVLLCSVCCTCLVSLSPGRLCSVYSSCSVSVNTALGKRMWRIRDPGEELSLVPGFPPDKAQPWHSFALIAKWALAGFALCLRGLPSAWCCLRVLSSLGMGRGGDVGMGCGGDPVQSVVGLGGAGMQEEATWGARWDLCSPDLVLHSSRVRQADTLGEGPGLSAEVTCGAEGSS